MGPVGAGVVTATFYNFSPSLVAHMIPRAWTLASPEQVLAARLDAARASLTRLLGDDGASSAEVAELAGLLREACSVLTPEGRPLYAGHADLPWPEEPLLQVWHGATLLREHRGDGHIAALLHAGLTGLEALITHTATGRGFTEAGRPGHPRLEGRGVGGVPAPPWPTAACSTTPGSPTRARRCGPASRRHTDALAAPTRGCTSGPSAPAACRAGQGALPPAGRRRRLRHAGPLRPLTRRRVADPSRRAYGRDTSRHWEAP